MVLSLDRPRARGEQLFKQHQPPTLNVQLAKSGGTYSLASPELASELQFQLGWIVHNGLH